ncbi:SGT1-domain-containing protein [Westerdykella ornata]|uniref:SGT1-domain-containing protein n=1 Tax=Westerdykella ornata TaxID=318751 RepID=A0A6A6JQ13_WESOR|nr:SGT1-domain-containing protein [Westerdykella ornata]KAF2278345.1 SGT1-domain-containing protein [Westerdykella ornata]
MDGAAPSDDLKWFGEGFDGFPKNLPPDVVEYIVCILDTKLSDAQTRERLQAFQRTLASLQKKFLKEYIWQRESIQLELIRENARWMLKGSTNYGDSVADEWLIVYLLRELSKEFGDVWLRVYDSDGEFLLIEAAKVLPKWLSPEIDGNRVWIHAGRLYILAPSATEEPKPLKLEEALMAITTSPAVAQPQPEIEKEAFHRLEGYPAAIAENQHHATLPLPRKVAHILHTNPSYIAPAVETFYLRDPISLRLLQPAKGDASLAFPPEDFVEISVRFTKVLYAQLLGQRWVPRGPWADALESLVHKDRQPLVSPEKAELGIKVAAGMEMLVRHKIYADKKAAREINLLLEELDSGDDVLPTDSEIARWPKREDDERWLNIDFSEFERELAGSGGSDGFGDKAAQQNLRKMVERFNAFMEDEDADLEGARGLGLDPMDRDDDSDADQRGWEDPESEDDSTDDDYADAEYAEYEKAFEKFMSLSSAEKSALTDDARELARAEEAEQEEDEEIKKLSEMMEAELFSHGALNLNPAPTTGKASNKTVSFTDKGKGKKKVEVSEQDDEYEDNLLDDDYNLAENMLRSFKGQVGMAGPAGNLMGLMGVQFPPDEDDHSG